MSDKSDLMKIDKYLLRSILCAHSKTPIEQLHLETATLSIPQIIATRRMIYLQTILKRPKRKLIRNIYEAMIEDSLPGDWCQQIQNDFEKINLNMNNKLIETMNEEEYKVLIKKTRLKKKHSKNSKICKQDIKKVIPYIMKI